MQISPSILSANFWKLNEEIASIEDHVDWIHVDVMDNHFVPNLTIGPVVVKGIESKKPLDCHLMIQNPERLIGSFIKAWTKKDWWQKIWYISTHIEEWKDSVLRCKKMCSDSWIKYWVVINPPTNVHEILWVLDDVDYVLVMSVNPGFGWQSFMPEVLAKVRKIKEIKPDMLVQIDWWINDETVSMAKSAWVDNVVSGSYIFWAEDRIAAIDKLK